MQFTVAQLLEQFADQQPVSAHTIEQNLVTGDDPQAVRELQIALDALEKSGILTKEGDSYRLTLEEGVVPARLRCSSKGFCFAIQDNSDSEDVYIHESRLSGAWNGDRVLVKVTKDGVRRRSPEGEVRLILERATPTVLAKVKQTEQGLRAQPLDDRMLFEVEVIPSEETPDIEQAKDRLAHVEIVRYALGSHPPLGKILQILGESPETTNDVDLICCKYNLPRRFGVKELSEAASAPRSVRKLDLKHRLDLRELTTLRLGNAPALSLETTDRGWTLGVHIPDVATYVAPDSVMDSTARKRGRTFWVGETVLPMLPEISVLNQPESLTVSLLIHLDRVGNILSYEIHPTAITISASLSYLRAQTCLTQGLTEAIEVDDQSINQRLAPQVLQLLQDIVNIGAILPSCPMRIQLPPQKQIYDLLEPDDAPWGVPVLPTTLPIAGVISDICVLSNRLIAEHLNALGLAIPYANQASPDGNKLNDWCKLYSSMTGADLDNFVPTAHGLQVLINQLPPDRQETLAYLLWKNWRISEYDAQPKWHFGIGRSVYTHAILPQHRYSDLLVQRLLHMVFDASRDRRTTWSKEGINLTSSSCHGQINGSIFSAELAETWHNSLQKCLPQINHQSNLHYRVLNDLEGLRKAELMRSQIGNNFYGLVTGVQSYGFFVELEEFLAEGLVHVSSLKDDWYEFPPSNGKSKPRQNNILVGKRSGRQYALGDRVEVQIKGVDYYRQQIDLGTVLPELEPESAEPENPIRETGEIAD